MEKRFIIYFHHINEKEQLYSLPFVHYWNIRFDSAEELFSECNDLIFDSKDYFKDWDIDSGHFLDFLISISSRIIHACVIGYEKTGNHMKGYLKLPEKNIIEVEGNVEKIEQLDDFIRTFHIDLTDREKESITYIKREQ